MPATGEPLTSDGQAPEPPESDDESAPDALADPAPVVGAARRVWSRWIIALVTFAGFAAVGVTLVSVQPTEYQSTAVLAFQPAPGEPVGADLVTLLAERYPELVASQGAIDLAARASSSTPSAVQRGLSAAITPLTLNLVISVRLPTASQAQEAVASLVRQVAAEDARDPYLTSVVVAAPSLPTGPAGLPRSVLYVLALVTAAIMAVVVVAIVSAIGQARQSRTAAH